MSRKTNRTLSPRTAAGTGVAAAVSAAVVERGRALAADPTYPPFEVCQEVARIWLKSVAAQT